MKLLLIHAQRSATQWPSIPMTICRIAAAVEGAGHRAEVLDLAFVRDFESEVARAVVDCRPDVVGIGFEEDPRNRCSHARLAVVNRRVVEPLRRAFQGPFVVVGTQAGVDTAELLERLGLEIATLGDHEITVVELLHRLEAGRPASGTAGLAVRLPDGSLARSLPRLARRLDLLPRTRLRRYIDVARYLTLDVPLPIESSRGDAVSGANLDLEPSRFRLRDPLRVAAEIESHYRELGHDRFEIVDRPFNVPVNHCKAVLRALIATRLPLRLSASRLEPSAIDEELVILLERAGCHDVGLTAAPDQSADLLQAVSRLQQQDFGLRVELRSGTEIEGGGATLETIDRLVAAVSRWNLVDLKVDAAIGGPHVLESEASAVQPRSATLGAPNVVCDGGWTDLGGLPLLLTRVVALIMRKLLPRQPRWRSQIVARRIMQLLGVGSGRRRPAKHDLPGAVKGTGLEEAA